MAQDPDKLKEAAATHAVEYVQSGMAVGLGTGSTATFAVREIGRRVAEEGLKIIGVPTSERTARLARELGIPLTTLEDCSHLDITIDGADEIVLGSLHAIKGLGGALLREKIVALASRHMTVIVDESKVVEKLGKHTPVPIEVVTFGWTHTCANLTALGGEPQRRTKEDGSPYLTDGGNYLLDCRFPPIDDPRALAEEIKRITGVVEHGLFVEIADRVVVAGKGGVRVVEGC